MKPAKLLLFFTVVILAIIILAPRASASLLFGNTGLQQYNQQYNSSNLSFRNWGQQSLVLPPLGSSFSQTSPVNPPVSPVSNFNLFNYRIGGYFTPNNNYSASPAPPVISPISPIQQPASPEGKTGIFSNGAVTLRFDDGESSQYTNAIPKLNSAGMKGTFYIISRQIADNGFSGYMSKSQILDLYWAGNEIGAHSRTHPHLTGLSSTQIKEEVLGSKQDLESWNVGPINSFSYPYGEINSIITQTVKDAGYNSAASIKRGDVTSNSDRFNLEEQSVEAGTSPEQVKQWINGAIANKEWLILTFHRIDNSNDQYSISPEIFNQIIDYLTQTKVPVITVSEGVKSLK